MTSSETPSDPPPKESLGPPQGQSGDPSPGAVSKFVVAIGAISGIIAIIVPVVTWDKLPNSLTRALAIVGILMLAWLLVRISQWKSRTLSRIAIIDLLAVGVLCICGTVVLVEVFGPLRPSPTSASGQEAQHAAIPTGRFIFPEPTPDDPVPMVPLQMTVQVTANLEGDVLVIGNATVQNPVLTFESSVTQVNGSTWHANITFGQPLNAGCVFNLWAVAMPQSLQSYLVAEANSSRKKQETSWTAPGIPPAPPAHMLQEISVMRQSCPSHDVCHC
jgi:hypothetical protein